jgi:hypothetical protein
MAIETCGAAGARRLAGRQGTARSENRECRARLLLPSPDPEESENNGEVGEPNERLLALT